MGSDSPVELFRTIHGSHLYGLDHEGSDTDYFIVNTSDRTRARHSVREFDTTTMGWRLFLERAASGSHQSVEALFSPYKIWTPEGEKIRPMVEGMRITGRDVFEKYERTIVKFAHGDFKRRRHAARLSLNLRGLRAEGRFNPVMEPMDHWWAEVVAREMADDELANFLLSW